jgi:hypothetical protein
MLDGVKLGLAVLFVVVVGICATVVLGICGALARQMLSEMPMRGAL